MTTEENIQQERLEQIIADRLGERHRKMTQINVWERKRKVQRMKFVSLAAAACAAIAIVVAPFLVQSSSPLDELGIECSATEYRAAFGEMSEIESLIESQQYDDALWMIDEELENCKDHIFQMDVIADGLDEDERDYEIDMCKSTISELRWIRIYILTRMEQYSDARKELHAYLKDKKYCEHNAEAKQLMAALKEKDKNFIEKWVSFYSSMLK